MKQLNWNAMIAAECELSLNRELYHHITMRKLPTNLTYRREDGILMFVGLVQTDGLVDRKHYGTGNLHDSELIERILEGEILWLTPHLDAKVGVMTYNGITSWQSARVYSIEITKKPTWKDGYIRVEY